MGTDCTGRHQCEPDHYPTTLGQEWTCPDCGLRHDSYQIGENRYGIPADSIGWRSR